MIQLTLSQLEQISGGNTNNNENGDVDLGAYSGMIVWTALLVGFGIYNLATNGFPTLPPPPTPGDRLLNCGGSLILGGLLGGPFGAVVGARFC